MALPALATTSDLEARMSVTVGDDAGRAVALLTDASATVRAYTGQQFSAGSSTARLRPRSGRVRLPQRPITDVTGATDRNGHDLTFTWDGGELVTVGGCGPVTVSYDHGGEIPAEIVAVVCQIAGRAFGTPAERGGLSGEEIGDYSYSRGTIAAAGSVGLLPDEKAALDRFRRVGGSVQLA